MWRKTAVRLHNASPVYHDAPLTQHPGADLTSLQHFVVRRSFFVFVFLFYCNTARAQRMTQVIRVNVRAPCAAAARGGRGLAAPPAAREEESNDLLKGMSVEPEEGFKVDRRS
ncbi:hypothetical protein F2P81_019279 [Scophthalmus maximus]|uniref:Uncharacterized protein n=1 Tax=Scophthalmus maximus TaxID=52904 RepID=A0A6A4SC24_SCOMX|nr:hypothetical protein F2P81_019279 [Scophthalmus maximus]